VILFELTGEYSIILPLMLAIVLASGVSQLASRDTVYTRKLLRRGIDIDEPADAALRHRPVSAFMVAPPAAVPADLPLRNVAALFLRSREAALPVSDRDGRYLGILTAHDLMDALAAGESTDVVTLSRIDQTVGPSDALSVALKQLDGSADAVPVAADDGRLVGWLRHRDLLAALSGGPAPPRVVSPDGVSSSALRAEPGLASAERTAS
jgi:CIC family chloride channel protein